MKIGFADDLTIVKKIESSDDYLDMKTKIQFIENWCLSNNMSINVKKTQFVSFSRKNDKNENPKYVINGKEVVKSCNAKVLGVILDSELRWNKHIDYIESKAFKRLGLVRTISRGISDENIKKMLYQSTIRPILEYCSCVWGVQGIKTTERLERIQKKRYSLYHPRL